MHKLFARICAVTAVMLSSPAFADSGAAQETLWQRFAFEVGGGYYRTNSEPDASGLGVNFGLGMRMGEGVVMLRHSIYNNGLDAMLVPIATFPFCQLADDCRVNLAEHRAISLAYQHPINRYLSAGIGLGMVESIVEYEVLEGENAGEIREDKSSRGALFADINAHLPLSRIHHWSLLLGLRGQINSDFHSIGYILGIQKGF